MADTLTKLIKHSTKQIKKLRSSVNKLKKEQEAEQRKRKKHDKTHENKREEITVHFSLMSVAKATLVIIGLVILANFLGDISNVIIIFFVSVLFAAALDPTVDKLEEYKLPRWLSIILLFLILIFILGFFVSQLVPLIAVQLVELARSLSSLANKIVEGEIAIPFSEQIKPIIEQIDQELIVDQLQKGLTALSDQLESIADNTFNAIKAIFNGLLNFVLILILTFFLVVDEKGVEDFFLSLFPSKHGKYIVEKTEAVKNKVGFWLRGQMILMILMFGITLLGLLILGIDYALTLAMMAGIAELIPVVGPIAAGIPTLLVAFNQSPWLVLWALGLIIVLQQIEGNVLVPLVMKKAVGLSPIIVILAMAIGLAKLGILGMIIAVPVATTLSIFVSDYAAKEK